MKKPLLILILVLMASPVYAFTSAIQGVVTGGVASTALSCTTSDDTAILDKIALGAADNSKYACMKFTQATQFRVTEYVVSGDVNTGTSGGIEISIYDHNSGTDLPSTQVADTAVTLPYDETQNIPFTVTLAAPKDMSAGTYWICTIETGDTDRTYDYYTSSGDRACYGIDSCSTGSANTAISARIMGCTP